MTGTITLFITLLICISLFMFAIGRCYENCRFNKFLSKASITFKDEYEREKNKLYHLRNDDTFMPIMMVSGILSLYIAFCFIVCSTNEVRKKYINEYRDDKIVEQIDYKYKVIGGEKVIVDSTFTYVLNKD